MALPTIRFHRFPTGAGNMSNLMMALHGLLLEAGWVANFLSTAAIGTGTAAAPRWDTAAGTNRSAGRAIYIMPANGFVRQWHVEIDPWWGGAVGQLNFRIRVGLGSDTAGNLTGAGSNIYNFSLISTDANNTIETMISVSQDGLFVGILGGFSTVTHMSIERARTFSGVVTEDLLIMGIARAATTGSLIGFFSPCVSIRRRASDGLEFPTRPMHIVTGMAGFNESMHPAHVTFSLAVSDGTVAAAAGPYSSSGEFSGCPRLFLYMFRSNLAVGSLHRVFVDGQQRNYLVQATFPAGMAVMVASE